MAQRMEGGTAAAQMALAGVILGTLGAFVQETGLDSLSIAFWRCAIGAAALGVVVALAGPRARRWPGSGALWLAALTGVLMVGNWVLFFEAIRLTGIAVATISFHIHPALVLLIGAAFFGSTLRAADLGWILAALGGLALAMGLADAPDTLAADRLAGVAAALGGAFLYAWVTLIARSLKEMSPYVLTLIQCLVGVPLLVAFGPVGPGEFGAAQWFWLAGIGVIHTGIVYVLIYGAMPRLSTAKVAMLLFAYPVSAVLVDMLVYGRMVTLQQGIGFALILLSGLAVAGLLPRLPARKPRAMS